MERQREIYLKVDATAFKFQNKPTSLPQYIVRYNVNIPARVVYDLEEREEALEKVKTLLQQDFLPTDTVEYQITGTYILQNKENGDTREWVGSFQICDSACPSVLSDFQTFNSDNFVVTSSEILNQANDTFTENGKSSKWTFDSLQSIVFNISVVVDGRHSVLEKRNLKRRKQFRNTFDLP